MSHTYTADGNYIVKILGKTYYAIVGNITDGAGITGYTEADAKTYNIMSRCFAEDLPIASCLTNLSSFAAYAKYLQVVKVPQTMSFANIENAAKVFANCFNLTSVTGIGYKLAHCRSVDNFFNNCTSLTTTDFVIPQDIQISGGISNIFKDCTALTSDIASLLPTDFVGSIFNVGKLFYGVKCVGTIPDNVLWNNPNITWVNTSECFTYSIAALRSQAPISWGGTAPDSLIKSNPSSTTYLTDSTSSGNVIVNVSGGTYLTFTQPISSLTLATVENSHANSVIQFNSGDSIIVSWPNTVNILGSADDEPVFIPNASYIISITNNLLIASEVQINQ